MEELQKYLDEKYPELRLLADQKDAVTFASGKICFYFSMDRAHESVNMADERLLDSLISAKEMIKDSIEKIKINLGKPEKILGMDVICVGGEYWAGAEVIDFLFGKMGEKAGVLSYNRIPVVYKWALD